MLPLIGATRSYAAAGSNEGLTKLGISLLSVARPVGNYGGCVIVDRTASMGGHGDAGRHTGTAVEMTAPVRD